MIYFFKDKISFYTLFGIFFVSIILMLPIKVLAANISFQRYLENRHYQVNNTIQKVQYIDPRINDLEQKVRELNGNVEVLTHKMNEMQEEIKRLNNNAEVKHDEKASSSAQQNLSTTKAQENFGNKPTKNDEAHDFNQLQESNLGSLKLNETGDVTGADINSNVNQSVKFSEPLTTVPETKTAQELLNLGKNYLNAHNYKAAESIFAIFSQRYPESELNHEADFYIGDALFGQKRYREAGQRYLAFYNQYPTSKYQPENLLKLAKSMSALNDLSVACETLSSITQKYQNVNPEIIQRIKKEQKQNKCQ